MADKSPFLLRERNPDVLNSIANLSNDEVFTPPSFANQMLDTVAAAWSASNKGANIWANKSVTFLDPFTKSGVFLREIVRRLSDGLEDEFPDLQERINHIVTKQVFGVAITELTALLARRSVYCSKFANGKHSICTEFDTPEGKIWFQRTEHTWVGGNIQRQIHPTENREVEVEVGGRCLYCRAPRQLFDRSSEAETYAYPFIHVNDVRQALSDWTKTSMNFDVIVGNPPYQMAGGAGGTNDSPLYHLFVQQALSLEPNHLTMVIPSRWMAGGRGLEDFRDGMLSDTKLSKIVDYSDSTDAFPGVSVKGGVCYFLWSKSHDGLCEVTRIVGNTKVVQKPRALSEFDVLVRQEESLEILRKVNRVSKGTVMEMVSGDTPFGLATNFRDYHASPGSSDVELHLVSEGKRQVRYTNRSNISRNLDLIDNWKVFVPKAYGAGESYPHQILGKPIVAGPGSVCTQTYLAVGPFESEEFARVFESYYRTKFFRFVVSLRKITQDAIRSTYKWVPPENQTKLLTDSDLFRKYALTDDEISFIESMIRPMDLTDA